MAETCSKKKKQMLEFMCCVFLWTALPEAEKHNGMLLPKFLIPPSIT